MRIEEEESPVKRVERMISENPVVVFSKPSCFMCHATKRLLASIGVYPMVININNIDDLLMLDSSPTVFIGGEFAGGIETIVSLHVGGLLVPMLRDAGALPISMPSLS